MLYFRKNVGRLAIIAWSLSLINVECTLAKEGFAFGKSAHHVTDVQFRHSLSPDNRALVFLFDNLNVAISNASPPVASRTLSLRYPMSGGTAADKLIVRIDGAVTGDSDTSSTLIVRVLGETHLIDISDTPKPGNFTKDVVVSAEGMSDLRLTLFLLVERPELHKLGEAILTIDTVEVAIPLPPEKK